MKPDAEFNALRNTVVAAWFKVGVADLYNGHGGLTWDERFIEFTDLLEEYGLRCYEHPARARTVVLWNADSRRTYPAFIALHSGMVKMFDSKVSVSTSFFSVEVVEAGKYGVAGASKDASPWAAEEGSAL